MSAHKILNAEEIPEALRMARVFALPTLLLTGVFDVLHRGHVQLLEESRDKFPDHQVWVGLNSDRAVRQLKGESRPIHDFESRAIVMAGLEAVHHVFEIDDSRVAHAIRLIMPRVWVKGSDYTLETLDQGERKAAEDVGAIIHFVPLLPGYSTTAILKKLGVDS